VHTFVAILFVLHDHAAVAVDRDAQLIGAIAKTVIFAKVHQVIIGRGLGYPRRMVVPEIEPSGIGPSCSKALEDGAVDETEAHPNDAKTLDP